MVSMLFKLVFVCTHVQFSASAHASSSGVDDCKSGVCTAQIEVDDATAMIQGKAKISLDGQISKEDVMLLTKSAGVGQLLEVKGIERLTAAQKMESSMETAVTKMIDGRGRALPEEVLKSIDTAMEDLRQELVGEKDVLQTQMNDANGAVAKCNTNMQATSGGGVATAKGSAVDTNETHRACRDAEVSAYDAKTAACDLLVSKTKIVSDAAPKCNCEMSGSDTTSAVLSCLANNRKWTEWHENNLTMQQSDCDTKTKTWSNKADACDTNQSSYEVAVCIYAGKLESMCTTLDTCYIDANASRTSMVASVKIEEQHLKAVLASAKKITCFMSILKNSTARNLTMSDLDVCKKLDVFLDKTYLSTAVNDLNISILPVDAKENCQMLTSTPGDDQWAAKEYAQYTKAWLRESAVCPHKTTTTTTTKATTTTTTTQATCTFTLTMKRKWGANWMLDVQGAVGDTFTAQGCSPTARGASDCIAKGWGAGITPVVNQHGNVVAYGNCCIEENEVTNTSKCNQAVKTFTCDSVLRTYEESATFCANQGKQIASIANDDEQLAVGAACASSSYTVFYIGAKSDGAGNWRWVDGTPWGYIPAGTTDTTGTTETRMAYVKKTQEWHDYGQGEIKLGVVCMQAR